MRTQFLSRSSLFRRGVRATAVGIVMGVAVGITFATSMMVARGGGSESVGTKALAAKETKVLENLRLVERGEVLDLARVTTFSAETKNQFIDPANTSIIHGRGFLIRNLGGLVFPAFERIEGSLSQQGTQIDSFNHFGHFVGTDPGNREHWSFANELPFEDVYPVTARDDTGEPVAYGTPLLGAETIPPFIARGVLVDVAGYLGVETMNPGQAITLPLFRRALGRTEIRAGDVVLINTGWEAHWGHSSYFFTDGKVQEPGIDLEVAQYLADRGVAVIGADNFGVEVAPAVDPQVAPFPIHQELLGKGRVYLLENLALRELAARAAENERWKEFLFIMTVNKVAGASGSNVTPLAIR
jgi:kynurenine formamidase